MVDRPAKRQRLGLSDTIIISAGKGEEAREFSVPTSFATRSSKFIKAALSNPMKEAREKRTKLPGIDPETLEGYLNWVYSRQITLKHEGPSCPLCSRAEGTPVHFVGGLDLDVAKMYTLGDYLIDLQFCNAITDMLKPAACKGVLLPTADAVI